MYSHPLCLDLWRGHRVVQQAVPGAVESLFRSLFPGLQEASNRFRGGHAKMRGARRDHESSFPRAAWGVGWGFGGYAKTGLETLFWLDLGRKFSTVESCP